MAALKSATRNPNYNLFKASFFIRTYSNGTTATQPPRNNLYSRISPLGDPTLSVVPALDQWVKEGRKVKSLELQHIIRDLRTRRRFSHALQISEWMSAKGLCQFLPGDCAIQLNLIAKVRGLEAAQDYFNNTSDEEKTDKLYGALLNCYIMEGLVEESLSHLQKMKQMGFANSALTYSNLMCLYVRTGQLEKIPDVLSEMKENGVAPNNLAYRVCINSYGLKSDFDSMEKTLAEMEVQPDISMDWNTYSAVANIYVKANLAEKALVFFKKAEAKVYKDTLGYNHLISHYASLGKKEEVMRLWGLLKVTSKKLINRDYVTILGSLVKLGEFEETEILLKEWESTCFCYDFRVPNILLIGYCQKGSIEKAEALLKDIVKKGKVPIPNSWAIIALAYVDTRNMEKAYECMKEAIAVHERNKGWRPKPRLRSSILSWIGENREVGEVEAFVSSLKTVVPMDKEMYHALVKASIRGGKEVESIVERMKADENVGVDEETELMILSSRQRKDE